MRARPTTDGSAPSPQLKRLARRTWPYRNPLARAGDRVEAAVLLIVVLVGLVMTPLAAARGSEAYADQRAATELQHRTRQPATAVLLADPPLLSLTSPGRVVHGKTPVQARWSLPDGSTRTGEIQADDWLRAGTSLTIWVDPSGNPVTAPPTADAAVVSGLRAAFGNWLAVMVVLAAGYAALRYLLNRSRKAAWQRDWESVEPSWSGRATA